MQKDRPSSNAIQEKGPETGPFPLLSIVIVDDGLAAATVLIFLLDHGGAVSRFALPLFNHSGTVSVPVPITMTLTHSYTGAYWTDADADTSVAKLATVAIIKAYFMEFLTACWVEEVISCACICSEKSWRKMRAVRDFRTRFPGPVTNR